MTGIKTFGYNQSINQDWFHFSPAKLMVVLPGGFCLTGRGGSEAVKQMRRESLGRRFSRKEKSGLSSRCSSWGSVTIFLISAGLAFLTPETHNTGQNYTDSTQLTSSFLTYYGIRASCRSNSNLHHPCEHHNYSLTTMSQLQRDFILKLS